MHGLGQVGEHLPRLGTVAMQPRELLQRFAGSAAKQLLEQIEDAPAIGQAQHGAHLGGVDAAGTHGQRLIEQREPIAHRALGRTRDQRQGVVLGFAAFLGDDLLEVLHQHRHVDAAQIETLAARQHRHRHLAHLGRGEDELHMAGRLFQRLQQRVERALGEHVHLVDEVHLVAGDQWPIARALDDLADVVDAGIGGRVHLQHVRVPPFHDLDAVAAELGHVERGLVHAVAFVVQGPREDARRGGLADARARRSA